MAKKDKKNITMRDLLVTKLQALADIEDQISKATPKLIKKISSKDLKQAFEDHMRETQIQAERLEEAFELLGEKPRKLKVEAIRGLLEDAQWITKNVKEPNALDAALIAAMQYVEHYETAGYGTAAEWAKLLNEPEVALLLEQTLEEEKAEDEKLSELATSKINDRVIAQPVQSLL